MSRAPRLTALGGLTELEDRFCTLVAQGFNPSQAAIRAGYKDRRSGDELLQSVLVLRTIVKRVSEHRRDVGAIELLSKGKRRLNDLLDSSDDKIVLGAASTVLKVFSGPGRKTLMEKAVEEDFKTQDLAALARNLLPDQNIQDAEIIEEPKLLDDGCNKRND